MWCQFLAGPPWESGGVLDGPGYDENLQVRGEYLVHSQMCGLCHTQINLTGIYSGDDFYLAGGMRVGAYPHGYFVSRNLTSDPETGLGNWTVEEVATAIRTARTPDRVLSVYAMPWINLHSLSEEDALAVATFLKSQPPVYNKIPKPLHYGVVETLIAKTVAGLPASPPRVLTYADQNFGRTESGGLPRDWPQTALVLAQWAVVAAGLAAYISAGPPDKRWPATAKGWIKTGAALFGILLLGMIGSIIYKTPTLKILPPEIITTPFEELVLMPNQADFATEEGLTLAERGAYVYQITSCAMCHGIDGNGGLKLSWAGSGTLWVRNISSDLETGIGAWSDEDIVRAIRSGVTPDGRVLHWQGMIWDHAGNWDEEDIRALVAYLRILPPVENLIPETRPPAPDDCVTYTFWVSPSESFGCNP